MSVYTTELRYICEFEAGRTESAGLAQIDEIINDSRRAIFGTYPIFDEAYRGTLETMILKHYYMWEIGAETVGLFKLWLNERMNEIMPKYNLMYKALDFIKARVNPFEDVDLSTTHEGQDDTVGSRAENRSASSSETSTRAEQEAGSRNENESGSSENATSSTSGSQQTATTDGLQKYADTPQGGLSGLLNDTYLTNATKNDNTDTSSTSATSASANAGSDSRERSGSDSRVRSGADEREGSNTENMSETQSSLTASQYVEKIVGKRSGSSFYADFYEMTSKLKSIDMMIIRDLQDLFMGVW